ncbi:MAG: putative short chain dehydrogenase [Frankiales bacterium]|nr:putative short chain dehydrogenase [Frankiales bacterium]
MTSLQERATAAGIDPERLAVFLEVAAELEDQPSDSPDVAVAMRATARLFKSVKVNRRREKRIEVLENDLAVTAATATAAPDRIDDETRGVPLQATATSRTVGTLKNPRSCYVCKQRYTEVDAFYHQLCPVCAAENAARRDARTDLTGRRALLTGGRAKIGMHIALRLLRDGAHTTITTRFPNDAVRRFAGMPDSADWLHRLKVVGIDLRDPRQVVDLCDTVAADGPLDVLINNAAQTVKRSPGAYGQLVALESAPLPQGELPAVVDLSRGATELGSGVASFTPEALTALALTAGSASLERVAAGTAIDAGGLVPDLVDVNSWTQGVADVDPLELLEVQLCNVTAPFLLVSRLRASMAASPARRKHVVNVSAMEGVFSRGYKGPGHPHTNMAKAALNMLTRTSAREMFETDGILMTAVDTGWITDERPHTTKARLAEEGFHAPLDLVDGAARVYDPVVRGEQGEDRFGVFLKDYRPAPW